ncbi:permease prefix domain 1-containing protein [Luteitalea pratensis]|uniref:permease prefix domain 1-containing protein n=1 Tax=Luteitalea pratensis TaxID=1855912 RepID=UPI003AAC86D4
MLFARLRSFWQHGLHRSALEREIAEELQFHIERRADNLAISHGLPAEEALRLARLEFGAIEKYKGERGGASVSASSTKCAATCATPGVRCGAARALPRQPSRRWRSASAPIPRSSA